MERQEIIKPVLGYGSQLVIGHWDEVSNRFLPLTDKSVLENECEKFMAGNSIYPLAIKIMDTQVDGAYPTYRAIGEKWENPRVIMYAEEDENSKVSIKLKQ
jgi:hypothetical protein